MRLSCIYGVLIFSFCSKYLLLLSIGNTLLYFTTHMLPPELVQLIAEELDLPSLCALYDTNTFWRHSLTDNVFRHKLQLLCPWFEPQYSHFDTWRECSSEYVRRLNGGKFAPKVVESKESASLGAESVVSKLEYLPMFRNSEYTSEEGIVVDLSGIFAEYADYIDDPEFEPQTEYQVYSYPHMVVCVFMALSDKCFHHCDVVVKFKESSTKNPDIVKHLQTTDVPLLYTLGRHTFLFYTHSHCYYSAFLNPAALYLSKDQFVSVDIGLDELEHAVVYNGLIGFFGKKRYYTLQANLETTPVRDSSWIKHILRSTGSYRGVSWDSKYVVVMRREKRYLFDVQQNTLKRLDDVVWRKMKRNQLEGLRRYVPLVVLGVAAVVHWSAVLYFCSGWF